MRKKLVIIAAVILLLLLSFWGFLEYRQYSSYKTPIHRDAAMIVKINADEFIKSFLKEYGFNFRDKIKSNSKGQPGEKSNTGLYLPANIFIYTLKDKGPSTFICSLPLSDEHDFQLFAGRTWNVSFSAGNEATAFDGKLVIVCSKDYAAIAWSEQKENVKPVLLDLLNKRNLIASDDELIKSLKKDRSHIVVVSDKINAAVTFSGNEIELNGRFEIPAGFSIPEQLIKTQQDSNGYASFYLNMVPAKSVLKEKYSIKEYELESDSLLKYYNGYIDISISGITSQTDTVTTYEYDDNFEKKEKRTLTTTTIPQIEMIVQGKSNLYEYLQKQKFINSDGWINRDVFPLYKVSATQSGEGILLHTGEQLFKPREFQATHNFIEAEINLEKLKPLTDSTVLGKFSTGIKKISLAGIKMNDREFAINSQIIFESGALKTIIELIRFSIKRQ